jgi:hypothetical protein
MNHSWDLYYERHSAEFDENHRMSIYIKEGNEDLMLELGYQYLEDEDDLSIEMPVGKWSPSSTEDKTGEETDCIEIQHKVVKGWEAEDSWWNKEGEQEEYIKKYFGIGSSFLHSVGVWNCE